MKIPNILCTVAGPYLMDDTSIDSVFQADQLNARRLVLLSSLAKLLTSDPLPCEAALQKELSDCIKGQEVAVLSTLRKPLLEEDIGPILELCASREPLLRDM